MALRGDGCTAVSLTDVAGAGRRKSAGARRRPSAQSPPSQTAHAASRGFEGRIARCSSNLASMTWLSTGWSSHSSSWATSARSRRSQLSQSGSGYLPVPSQSEHICSNREMRARPSAGTTGWSAGTTTGSSKGLLEADSCGRAAPGATPEVRAPSPASRSRSRLLDRTCRTQDHAPPQRLGGDLRRGHYRLLADERPLPRF